MTEETAQKLVELLELYTKADKLASIFLMSAIVGIAIMLAFDYAIARKKRIERQKAIKEYKATLSEEQLKQIEQYERISK